MSLRSACASAALAVTLVAGCSTTTPTPAPTSSAAPSSVSASTSASSDQTKPAAATDQHGIVIAQGKPDTPMVDIYIDFQCPFCGELDRAIAPQLERMASEQSATVAVHPMVFLDGNLGNDSSTRMANLFVCSSEVSTDAARHFYTQAFAQQPSEGKGYDDALVDTIFADATIAAADVTRIKQCATDETYGGWVQGVDAAALAAGVKATPAVHRNGTPFNVGAVANAEDFYQALTQG